MWLKLRKKLRGFFWKKPCDMKCCTGLRKAEDGLLNATKNLFLGKTLDTIAKQVYCYRLMFQ